MSPTRGASPEGTTGKERTNSYRPFGAFERVCRHVHGLTPVATTYRPFGTNGTPLTVTAWHFCMQVSGGKTVEWRKTGDGARADVGRGAGDGDRL